MSKESVFFKVLLPVVYFYDVLGYMVLMTDSDVVIFVLG